MKKQDDFNDKMEDLFNFLGDKINIMENLQRQARLNTLLSDLEIELPKEDEDE